MGRPPSVFTNPPPDVIVTGEKPFDKPPRVDVHQTTPAKTGGNWWDNILDIFSPSSGGGIFPEASAEEETTAPPVAPSSDLESRIAQLERVQQTYPQLPSASQKSDVDIWRHLEQWVWGKSGAESMIAGESPEFYGWEAEPTAIRNIQKAQTIEYKQLHENQRVQLSDALEHRGKLEEKIETNIDKIKTHTHNGGGGGDECEFWDIGCKLGKSLEGLGKVVLVAGVALIVFYAFKKGLIGRAVGKIK